jgi:hypothetical protein
MMQKVKPQPQIPQNSTLKAEGKGDFVHPRQTILPITDKEPLAIKLFRARLKKAEMVKAGQLTMQDSVKLNAKVLYPDSLDVFSDNVLVRSLHPADTLAVRQIKPSIVDSSTVVSDSTAHFRPDSLVVQPKVAVKTAITTVMPQKNKSLQGFSAQMGWLGPVLILVLLFAGTIKAYSGKYIGLLFKAMFNQQHADNLYQMVNVRNSLSSRGLDLLFVLVLGLFVQLGGAHLGLGGSALFSPLVFCLICGVIVLLMLVKTSGYKFLGYVFNVGEETRRFVFFVFVYTRTTGLMILPIVVIIAFVEPWLGYLLLEIGLFLIVAMYLMQLAQGVKIFLRHPAALFYMFLYLCALEILPILVAVRFLSR